MAKKKKSAWLWILGGLALLYAIWKWLSGKTTTGKEKTVAAKMLAGTATAQDYIDLGAPQGPAYAAEAWLWGYTHGLDQKWMSPAIDAMHNFDSVWAHQGMSWATQQASINKFFAAAGGRPGVWAQIPGIP